MSGRKGPVGDAISQRTADLLALADVHRWSVIKTLRTQSVAEHSFAVAVIAMELSERIWGAIVFESCTLLWAIIHDAPETYTGDIDGKCKRDFPDLTVELRDVEDEMFPWYKRWKSIVPSYVVALVKIADIIEAASFIKQWGIGERADDVFWELHKLLYEVHIPAFNAAINLTGKELVKEAVDIIMNQSTHERNTVQFRRKTEAAET